MPCDSQPPVPTETPAHSRHSSPAQTSTPLFSCSCALFCASQEVISSVFKLFRTLCQKDPGWGYLFVFRRLAIHHSPLVIRLPRPCRGHCSSPSPARSLFSYSYKLLLPQPPCFDTLTKTPGVAWLSFIGRPKVSLQDSTPGERKSFP